MSLFSQLTRRVFPILLMAVLVTFPLMAYFVRSFLDTKAFFVFGPIGMVMLVAVVLERYLSGGTIRLPIYVVVLGLFVFYTLVTGVMVSDVIAETGLLRYLLKDPFLLCFVFFLIIENLEFSPGLIKVAIRILVGTMILAAVVSILQISDPFFFMDNSLLKETKAAPAERFLQYYSSNPEETTGAIRRLMRGYRFSIFSWVTGTSVGMDGMAIFSILFGLSRLSWKAWSLTWISSALVSFLSSSRWIILNFIIISFQRVLSGKRVMIKALKYLVLIIVMIVLTIYGAGLLGIDMEKFVYNRLLATSFTTRIYAFEVFFRLFPEQPIWGTGGAETAEMLRLTVNRGTSTIHVGWLLLFFYYGLVGGLIYIAFVWTLMLDLYRRAQATFYWGSFFAFLGFLLANLTLPAIEPAFYGLFLALIFSKSVDNKAGKTPVQKIRQPALKAQVSPGTTHRKLVDNW